jgi:hypothetical protein
VRWTGHWSSLPSVQGELRSRSLGQRAGLWSGSTLRGRCSRRHSDNRVDITLDDGGTGSLWWATKNEWLGLLDVAGLHLEALYGGFSGEPLDDDSREYVFVARR